VLLNSVCVVRIFMCLFCGQFLVFLFFGKKQEKDEKNKKGKNRVNGN
jgi:hypothetical protein